MGLFGSIDQYLIHTVDINHITFSRGDRTETSETGVSAWISQRDNVIRDVGGDHQATPFSRLRSTVVFLKPDQTITEQDEVVVDSVIRPVVEITKARDETGNIHHLEVLLG